MISPSEIQQKPNSHALTNHKTDTNNNNVDTNSGGGVCVKRKKRRRFEITIVDDFAFLAFKTNEDLEQQQEYDEAEIKTNATKRIKDTQKTKNINSNNKANNLGNNKPSKAKSTSSSTCSNNNDQDDNQSKKIKSKKSALAISQGSSKDKQCNGPRQQNDDGSLAKALEAKELAERRVFKLQEKLKAEQSKNRTLEEKIRESQAAVEAAERKEGELFSMKRRLIESNGLKREEKQKLEEDIELKQEEVARAWKKAEYLKENARITNNDDFNRTKEYHIKLESNHDSSSHVSNSSTTNSVKDIRMEQQRQIYHHNSDHHQNSKQFTNYNNHDPNSSNINRLGSIINSSQPSYPYINDNGTTVSYGNQSSRQPAAIERLHQIPNNGLVQNEINRDPSATQYCPSPLHPTQGTPHQQMNTTPNQPAYYSPRSSLPSQPMPSTSRNSVMTMVNPYAVPPPHPPSSFMINETISRQTSIIPSMSALESSISSNRYMHHPSIEQSLHQISQYDPTAHHASMYYPGLQDRNFIESRLHSSHHLGPHSVSTHQMVQAVPMPASMTPMQQPVQRPPVGAYAMMNPFASTASAASSPLNPYFDRWYETQRALTRTYSNLYQNTASYPTGYPHMHQRPHPFPQGIFPPPF